MIYIDAGTTYSKIIEINSTNMSCFNDEFFVKKSQNKAYYIVPSSIIKKQKFEIKKCCGHMSSNNQDNIYENEIIALAKGCRNMTDENAVVLDLGSRDAKWIRFKDNKFHDMDWNTSCASSTGATIEMLLKFYNLNAGDLKYNKEKFAVTCGTFGLEKIMEDISNGADSDDAISKFVHGIAYNAWNFAKNPPKIYLSGGFCENECFVESLKNYCEVITLGRFVLCEGLLNSDLEVSVV